MLLFLRWMVRRHPPDLGLWTFVDPAKLVMPVDTHIHRIATFLGLNRRKSADWKTARALTTTLARFDAADPVRYDFALCASTSSTSAAGSGARRTATSASCATSTAFPFNNSTWPTPMSGRTS